MSENRPSAGGGAGVLKRDLVVEHLRGLIVAGEFEPGERMPSRAELERRFAVGSSVIQGAFEQLKEEGFVHSEPRWGSFVADHPPHLSHYALVLGEYPDGQVPAFSRALQQSAATRLKAGERLVTYNNISRHHETAEDRQLFDDLVCHRVAGLIFRENPRWLAATPFLAVPGIPKVSIMNPPLVPGVVAIVADRRAYFDRALDHFLERGRRRVAFVTPEYLPARHMAHLADSARQRGMTLHDEWVLSVTPEGARNLTKLLMRPGQPDRPDALLIGDDGIVGAASLGLIDAGVRVGKDLDVIGHANFPMVLPGHVPMRRLGWDVGEYFRIATFLIDEMRAGRTVPEAVCVGPVFEDGVGRQPPAAVEPYVVQDDERGGV